MIGAIYYFESKNDRQDRPYRYMLIAGIILVVAFAIIATIAISLNRQVTGYIEVIVQPGDTVWTKVREIYGNRIDIRRIVDATIMHNGIDDSNLAVGSVIQIPIDVNRVASNRGTYIR